MRSRRRFLSAKEPNEEENEPQPSFAFGCLMDYLQELPQIVFSVPTHLPWEKQSSGSPNTNFWVDSSTAPTNITLEFLCCADLVDFELKISGVYDIFKAKDMELRAFHTSLEHSFPQVFTSRVAESNRLLRWNSLLCGRSSPPHSFVLVFCSVQIFFLVCKKLDFQNMREETMPCQWSDPRRLKSLLFSVPFWAE